MSPMICQIWVALNAIRAATIPPLVVCTGSPDNAMTGDGSPSVTSWLAFVRAVGTRTSEIAKCDPIAKYARL